MIERVRWPWCYSLLLTTMRSKGTSSSTEQVMKSEADLDAEGLHVGPDGDYALAMASRAQRGR